MTVGTMLYYQIYFLLLLCALAQGHKHRGPVKASASTLHPQHGHRHHHGRFTLNPPTKSTSQPSVYSTALEELQWPSGFTKIIKVNEFNTISVLEAVVMEMNTRVEGEIEGSESLLGDGGVAKLFAVGLLMGAALV